MANIRPSQSNRPDHAYFDVLPCPDDVVNSPVGSSLWEKLLKPRQKDLPLNSSISLHSACSTCLSVSKEIMTYRYEDSRFKEPDTKHGIPHQPSGHELEKSQIEGCHLCALLWSSFCSGEDQEPRTPAHITQKGDAYRDTTAVIREGVNIRLTLRSAGWTHILPTIEHPLIGNISGQWIRLEVPKASLGVHGWASRRGATEATDTNEKLISYPVFTCSEDLVDQTLCLLQECAASHGRCRKLANSARMALPTRLIRIGKGGPHKIKLQPTNTLDQDSLYTTLSYCWGASQTVRLRLEARTISQFESSIPFRKLPKTIREAIHFTHAIGVRYIWIDLLCIIQDSEEDMAREISVMHKIFENSHLNISALSSASMDQGLYAQRNPLQYCSAVVGQESTMNKLRFSPPQDHADSLFYWPVHLRGWIFQERIFSRRTLYFGPYLIWVCQESSQHEFDKPVSSRYTLGPQFRRLLARPTSTQKEKKEFIGNWHEILRHYLNTELGRQTDRLNAITGLIVDIEERTQWKNLKGLWEPFLLHELLWKPKAPPSDVPSTRLRPSWSWISVQGVIHTPPEWLGRRAARIDTRTPPWDDGTMILSVSCTPLQVLDFYTHKRHTCARLEKWPALGRVVFRLDSDERALPTHFLPLVRGEGPMSDMFVYGLAVAPSAIAEGMYERVGTMEASSISVRDLSIGDWRSGEYRELWSTMCNAATWMTFDLV